ncbi:hypothetical protein HO173_004095 [Letharia columbiana]|uniref:Required for respiratory growth protein 9, mitochondrial n=1 Tax=Letharia columbiana TaxID=112416 RepID=A0A8H6L732_9LECA|nr:uncharacterized protein HO173_004095 [Letharia columbiana]KAF6237894.1 hypothetical protein HO173_004095 [Letharia columbiana]
MPCSACAPGALRRYFTYTEAARTAGLRIRNVRCLTIDSSRHLFHIDSSLLRNQAACTHRISTLQPSQVPGFQAALSPVEDPTRRKEPSHRDRNGLMIRVEDPTEIHENLVGVAQTAKIPVELRSRRDSKFSGFLKPRSSPKDGESFDQVRLKENARNPGQRGDATSMWSKNSIREENSGSSKLAGSSRKARLQDYSSRTVEGSNEAMRSSRSAKASAYFRTGTQNYKDQREPWQTQKSALSEKFGPRGWLPRKRLSPDTLEGIRALHAQQPDKFTTPILADQFKVSPEAIRRILKSKWRPKDEEEERRRQRWEKRGENIWSQLVEIGIKPPKKWRDMGVGKSRERKPARRESVGSYLESNSESKVTSSLLGQSTTILHTIPANGHGTGSPVPLSDRML